MQSQAAEGLEATLSLGKADLVTHTISVPETGLLYSNMEPCHKVTSETSLNSYLRVSFCGYPRCHCLARCKPCFSAGTACQLLGNLELSECKLANASLAAITVLAIVKRGVGFSKYRKSHSRHNELAAEGDVIIR